VGSIGKRALSDTIYCMEVAVRYLHPYDGIDVIFFYEQVLDHWASVLAVQSCRKITLSVYVSYELADLAAKASLC
jgi:hypothetical protein